MWFVKALVGSGHRVLAAVRGPLDGYDGLKAARLKQISNGAFLVPNVPFGSDAFLDIVRQEGPFDLLYHHAADATNYKSIDFDAVAALDSNTRNLRKLLLALREAGCSKIVLTGSVFEMGEGAGSFPSRAFSPYGLSKSLTANTFGFYCDQEGFGLSKFVIPNPFGPFEEPRFTEYLMRCWTRGETAAVNTPAYVRDNIHVSLLAHAYRNFAEQAVDTGYVQLNPSGYVETQGAFATRFAYEIGRRLEIEAALRLVDQREFPEPAVRINTDKLYRAQVDWSEDEAWNELACYYAERFRLSCREVRS